MRRAQSREPVFGDEPEPFDARVVVHHDPAVGRTPGVELHAVGTQLARHRERGQGVLGPSVRRAPMTQHERTVEHDGAAYGGVDRNTFHQGARKSCSYPLPPQRFAR